MSNCLLPVKPSVSPLRSQGAKPGFTPRPPSPHELAVYPWRTRQLQTPSHPAMMQMTPHKPLAAAETRPSRRRPPIAPGKGGMTAAKQPPEFSSALPHPTLRTALRPYHCYHYCVCTTMCHVSWSLDDMVPSARRRSRSGDKLRPHRNSKAPAHTPHLRRLPDLSCPILFPCVIVSLIMAPQIVRLTRTVRHGSRLGMLRNHGVSAWGQSG